MVLLILLNTMMKNSYGVSRTENQCELGTLKRLGQLVTNYMATFDSIQPCSEIDSFGQAPIRQTGNYLLPLIRCQNFALGEPKLMTSHM